MSASTQPNHQCWDSRSESPTSEPFISLKARSYDLFIHVIFQITKSCTTNLSFLHATFYLLQHIKSPIIKLIEIEDWFIIDLISYHYMKMLFFHKLRCNSIITNKIMDLLKTLPILVFDIDGTLLFRTTQKIKDKRPHFNSNGRCIYLRPQLDYLIKHQHQLAKKAKLFLWTSMLRKNAIKIHQHLARLGLQFQKLYCQQECVQLTKDLSFIAKQLNIDVNLIHLIDDSPHKRIGNQNFIQIKQYLGTDDNDNQIPRIVKHLYNLLEIPFDQQLAQLEYQMNRFTIKQTQQNKQEDSQNGNSKLDHQYPQQKPKYSKQNKNKKKQKQKYKPKQQETQQLRTQTNKSQNKNTKYRQKNEKQQKQQQKNKKKKQQYIKFNQNTKVIVFDLSKTLIAKKKQQIVDLAILKNNYKIQGSIIYNRPHLSMLQKFKQVHETIDIKYLVWSTMTGKKVEQNCRQVVSNLGAPFEDVINGTNHQQGPFKDLTQVCNKYGCKIDNTILVDDSPYKQFKDQNFILINPYYGNKNDIQMIRICKKLDQFIGCQNPQCQIFKKFKQYEQQLLISQKENAKQHQAQLNKKYEKKTLQREQKNKLINEIIKKGKNIGKQFQHKEEGEEFQNLQIKNFKVKNFLEKQAKIKCIVFDINQTLLVRTQHKIQDLKCDQHFKQYYIYLRPHLNDLSGFLQKYEVNVCLWSTISVRNCEPFYKLLDQKGFKFAGKYTQENLVDKKKSLQFVSRQLNIPVQNIVLIDDNSKKRVESQNFVLISSFSPQNQQDDALLELIKQLEPFLQKKQKPHYQS